MKMLFVPVDKQGMDDCEYMRYDSDHVESFELTDEEYDEMWTEGVIHRINKACGTLIDDYEEDRIENEQLVNAITVLNKEKKWDRSQLSKAIRLAIEADTFVDTVF